MTGCVAITRMGYGLPYSFDSLEEADSHPLIQHGDVFIVGQDDVHRYYSPLTALEFVRRWGIPKMVDDCRHILEMSQGLSDRRRKQALRDSLDERLWRQLCALAQQPPTDPAEIVKMIAEDRIATRRLNMAESEKAAGKKTASEKTEKKAPEAPKAPAVIAGVPVTSVIRFGEKEDNTKYGIGDLNPKKKGSASHARFELYKDGMTVREALNVGITAADLKNDQGKGYIYFEAPSGGEAAASEAATA